MRTNYNNGISDIRAQTNRYWVNGLISGLGSALGGVLGLAGSNETNKANLQATRETNEQNYRIWQEQKSHNIDMFNRETQANLDMWNLQNAYNDPSAQAERLLKAGYNPLMALGSGAAGNATSAPSAGNAQPANAPTMQAPPSHVSGWLTAGQYMIDALTSISSSINTLSSAKNTDADTKNKLTEGLFLFEFLADRNKGQKTANDLLKEEVGAAIRSNRLFDRTEEAKVQQANLQTYIMQATYDGLLLSNESQKILNEWLPAEKKIAYMAQWEQIVGLMLDNDMKAVDAQYYLEEKVYDLLQKEANIANTKASTAKAYSDIKVNEANIKNIEANTEATEIQNSINRETAKDVAQTIVAEQVARRASASVEGFRLRAIDKSHKKDPASWEKFYRDSWRTEKDANRAKSWHFSLPLGVGYSQDNR